MTAFLRELADVSSSCGFMGDETSEVCSCRAREHHRPARVTGFRPFLTGARYRWVPLAERVDTARGAEGAVSAVGGSLRGSSGCVSATRTEEARSDACKRCFAGVGL